MHELKILAFTFGMLAISGCGGGGDGGASSEVTTPTPTPTPTPAPAPIPAPSPLQKQFENIALSAPFGTLRGLLPTEGITPEPGTHYFGAFGYQLLKSPAGGAKTAAYKYINLSNTLSAPTNNQVAVQRVLLDGRFYLREFADAVRFRYEGGMVIQESMASDGVTVLFATTYDDWSDPIPLSGPIESAEVLKQYHGTLDRTYDTLNFDFTKPWLAGAAYSVVKGYRTADTLLMNDGAKATTGAEVSAVSTSATDIAGFFGSKTGGILVMDGVNYTLSDGDIKSYGNATVWIAKNKRPEIYDLNSYRIVVALNQKIYFGSIQKANTRLRSFSAVDSSVVLDSSIRFNAIGFESIKSATKF
jgi:hypothetical protein